MEALSSKKGDLQANEPMNGPSQMHLSCMRNESSQLIAYHIYVKDFGMELCKGATEKMERNYCML